MLTVTRIAPGAGIAYLTRQVATGRHDFRPAQPNSVVAYHADPTARGEAPGWWAGASISLFGVQGAVTEQQLQRLLAEGKNPVTGEQLGRIWRKFQPLDDEGRRAAVEKAWAKLPKSATYEQIAQVWLNIWTAPERRPVAGFDVTVSPVKSISLLWAFGDDRVKRQVMASHHEGVRAALEHLRRHGAFTRLGTNGLVQVDTDGLAVAVYDHRMSREKDPQLHSHIIISAKVRITRDGQHQWLSLDSRALYQATVAARIAYERAVETELGRRLGVRFAARQGSTIREIVGFNPRMLVHYSKRRAAIEAEMHGRTTHPVTGRQQVPAGRWRRRAQDATLRTRTERDGAESTQEAVARWRREDRAAGLGTVDAVQRIVAGAVRDDIGRDALRVLRQAQRRGTGRLLNLEDLHLAAINLRIVDDEHRQLVVDAAVRRVPHLAVARAVEDLTGERAVFQIDHLELAIGRILDVEPGTSRAEDWQRVRQLAAYAIRTRAAGLRVLTPPALLDWATPFLRDSDRQSIYSRHRDLRLSTRAVLAAEHELLAYAARSGATAAPRALLDRVTDQLELTTEKRDALRFVVGDDRRVTGIVGPAGTGKTYLQRAVGIAAHHAGIPVLGFTVSQNAAYVLAAATREGGHPGIRTENIAMWLHAQAAAPEGTTAADWTFQPGQWVIVDEASQASTLDLVRLTQLLEPVGGKLILVGDPAQISAIGPGGMFRYLASLGHTTQLREVRRFQEPWEGPASLRLRDGDTTVLAEYDRRGRILGGDRQHLTRLVLNGWAADIIQGYDSLIMVETEAEAADIAAQARRILIQAGIVDPGPSVTLANGTHASTGDLVVTRRNNRDLIAGDLFVANRDQWTVRQVTDDGGLRVQNTTTGARLILPAEYVAEHVQLAYAATVDSAQGRTVDVGRALVDTATSLARLYVMATRGRMLNWLGVVTSDEPPEGHPAEPPSAGIAVLADILRADTSDRAATETERTLWADVDALYHWGPVYDDLTARAAAPRYVAVVRRAVGPRIAAALAADPAMPALAARLHSLAAAGYDPDTVLATVASARELHTARDVAAVLTWRIDEAYDDIRPDPRVALSPAQAASYTDRLPAASGELAATLASVAAICDRRVEALADLAAQHHPAWTRALGPVPDDEPGRRRWLAGAGVVAAYRDRYQVTADEPIGPEPSHRDPDRWAAWHRAQTVLGVATLAGRVAAADNTELRALVDAQRAADRAAPPYVSGELRDAHTSLVAAEQQLRDARLELATAQHLAARTTVPTEAARDTARWWHTGPGRARAAVEHHASAVAALRAEVLVAELSEHVTTAQARVSAARDAVAALEDRHREWSTWYTRTLPTRYAGLAAAAEGARRVTQVTAAATRVADAAWEAAAKVRAVDATRPNQHSTPVRAYLAEEAAAAYQRVTELADTEDTRPADPDLDLGHD